MPEPSKNPWSDDDDQPPPSRWPFSPLATIRIGVSVILVLATLIFGKGAWFDELAGNTGVSQPEPGFTIPVRIPFDLPSGLPSLPPRVQPSGSPEPSRPLYHPPGPVQVVPLGTPAEVTTTLGENLRITVKGFRTGIKSTIPEFGADKNGSGYTVLDVDVMHISGGHRDGNYVVTPFYFQIVGADGTVYPAAIPAGVDARLSHEPIPPGVSISGSIAFDVSPEAIKGAKAEFTYVGPTLARWQ